MKTLGVYIHIPFCRKKCNYCDFFSLGNSEEHINEYIKKLIKEIETSDIIEHKVDTIFFGGGTPSILSISQLEKILSAITKKIHIENNAEITLETNPCTNNNFQELNQIGFNRISFGVQSANNNELKFLGRLHTFEEFLKDYNEARKYFGNINLDLMYGIPLQTLSTWENTLSQVKDLAPQHISAYSLIIEPNTPFYNQELSLPTEDIETKMQNMIEEILHEYSKYEISNYSLPNFECKHNLKYWNMKDYIGYGAGAQSFIRTIPKIRGTSRTPSPTTRKVTNECRGGRPRPPETNFIDYRLENSKDLLNWTQTRKKVSHDDFLSEYIFLGLRQTKGIKLTNEILEKYGEIIDKYVKNNMLISDNNNLKFTPRGMEISNYILSDFI